MLLLLWMLMVTVTVTSREGQLALRQVETETAMQEECSTLHGGAGHRTQAS